MCGRFDFSWDEEQPAVRRMLALMRERWPQKDPPRGEICPGTPFPVLIEGGVRADVALLNWGIPGQSGLVINARAETVAQKPLFRECLRSRRGAVPATGFYEWNQTREKIRFFAPARRVLYLAALYDTDGRYAIVTQAANASAAPVHGRMPVILQVGELLPWLGDETYAAEVLRRPGPPLERERAV